MKAKSSTDHMEASAKSERLPKIKSVLISQPKPDKSPYFDIAEKWNIDVDFRKFIQVEGVDAKEVRKEKVNIQDYDAIIFTSRNAIDHFFRVCEEMRITMSQDTRYFCNSEAIALYLQKYVQYRKRKVFYGNGKIEDLQRLLLKYKKKINVLLPCSNVHKQDLPGFLEKNNFSYNTAVFYRTVFSDITDLANTTYDAILFFSPIGVKSLFHNFPDFQQNETRIGAFGPATKKAVEEAGLTLDIEAPTSEVPSMTMALENYLEKSNT